MDSAKSRDDERLVAAFDSLGLQDPRESYRSVLRELRARDADSFARSTAHYQQQVVPALASADPVAAWLDYGRVIGEMTAPGRLMSVDRTGRASAVRSPVRAGELIVYVPDEGTRGAFVAARPADPSAAQRATIGLLVEGRLALQDPGT